MFHFFSIFLGLSKLAFPKRFPGRPGNAIAIAFSFALTIALLVMERQFNFNLKSIGGLALGAIFLITGFFMISLARSAGIKYVTSFCLSYSLIYPIATRGLVSITSNAIPATIILAASSPACSAIAFLTLSNKVPSF